MRATSAGKKRRGQRVRGASDLRFRTHLEHLQALQRPVVLIAGDDTTRTLGFWREIFQYRLHVLSASPEHLDSEAEGSSRGVAASNDDIVSYLTTIGPVAAVIDERVPTLADRLQRWQRVFFHVASTGSYITPDMPVMSSWEAAVESLGSRRVGAPEIAEMRASISSSWSSDGHTVTEKDRDHLLKVKEEQALSILPSRIGAQNVRILGSVAPANAGGELVVRSFGTSDDHRVPARTMRAPELKLLEFRGRTDLLDNMIAVNGSTVLPSSFKHPWRPWNDSLHNFNDQIASLRGPDDKRQHLDGSYFDLTSAAPGDRGHFFTESLPKLWGWNEARRRDPELRAFYRTDPADPDAALQRDVLAAFGISQDSLQIEHQDVSVDTFVTASQAWQNGGRHFAHPVNKTVWSAVRSGLADAVDGPTKVFVTRRADAVETPGPRNAEEVEAHFTARGFTVFDPEAAPLHEIARMFSRATTVAGFAGSGMYPMLLSGALRRVIVLSHEANTGRNEHLIAALLAEEIDYLWSRPDVAQPAGKFSSEAFNSAWDFDFDANVKALETLLD